MVGRKDGNIGHDGMALIGFRIIPCMLILLLFSSLAPGPVVLVPHPSLVKISITWDKPAMPNGIITHYEVLYSWYHLVPSHNTTVNVTSTSFTTPDHLELGTKMIFTVRAYT